MRHLFILLILCINFSLSAQIINHATVSEKLLERIDNQPSVFHTIHILLEDRVDVEAMDANFYLKKVSLRERTQTLISSLKNKAAITQAPLLEFLQASNQILPQSVHAYWITNVIFASAKKEMIAALSQRNDVAWVGLSGPLETDKAECVEASGMLLAPNGIEPGLAAINAPQMWAMGYTGYGQVGFTNDTGIDPTHPAIFTKYRGFYIPKEEAWYQYNPATMGQSNNVTPFDCDDHGTHVTGTIMGLDRLENDTIGVAFNAQWIGAPILCGIGTEDNIAAFQWALDPDNNAATTEDMPDVINNSWRDPSIGTQDCQSIYVSIFQALEAAGIAVVFSAGNEGPDVSTITPPKNINLNLVNVFSVAALNANTPALGIANFSSRGPSYCGGDSSLLIKPEVAAPGFSVRSCVPGNEYDFFNGTSMAAPHVSGAILLLKEAFPELTGQELKLALYFTCTDLGVAGEDNTFGMGIINVKEAFNYLVTQGHEPVSPYRDNDVLLIDIKTNYFACEIEIAPTITIENGGSEPLTSFEISYQVAGNAPSLMSWTGNLTTSERTQVNLPLIEGLNGTHELTVRLFQPNGVADERPLNNILQKQVQFSSREGLNAYSPIDFLDAATICEDSEIMLRADYFGNGTVDVTWYDAPFGGNEVGQGQIFYSPPLTEPTIFYADALYNEFIGLNDKDIAPNYLLDTANFGQVFDVKSPMILKSIKVYIEQSGGRLLSLKNENNETVRSKVILLNQVGEQRIELDWEVPVGENYRLIKESGRPLFANSEGANYPYNIFDVIEITGNTQGAPDDWFYFYDWEIEFEEPCGRTPVLVNVISGNNIPTAAFSMSDDSLNLALESGDIIFTDESTDATQWLWHFGDGNTSTEQHPTHTYTNTGIYHVSLTIISEEACAAFASTTLFVENENVLNIPTPSGENHFHVFPNPANDRLHIFFDLNTAKNVELQLVDMFGKSLLNNAYSQISKEMIDLSLESLPSGIYYLILNFEGNRGVQKVIKQ